MSTSEKSEEKRVMMKNKNKTEEKKSAASRFFSFFGHLGSVVLLFLSALPFMRWFYSKSPALGVDFNLMTTYVNYLQHHWAWPWNGWKYIWFGGLPLFDDYPLLHFYAAVPWANIFGVFRGTQLYLLFTLFLFLFFCYLLFWEISRNKIISIILAASIGWSAIIYGSLVFGGNEPFFADLFFVSLALYLIAKYYHTKSKKYLLLAGIMSGLSFIGHSGTGLYFVLPISFLLIFFWLNDETRLFSWQKVKDLFIFGLITILVAGGVIYHYVVFYTQTRSLTSFGNFSNWSQRISYMNGLLLDRIKEINWLLLIGAVLFVILLIFTSLYKKQAKKTIFLLPFALILIYLILFLYFPQQWGGTWRIFWAFPLSLGLIIAASFGQIRKILHFSKFWPPIRGKIIICFISLIILGLSAGYFWYNSDEFFSYFDRTDLTDFYEKPILNSRTIGSYPGLVRYPLSSQEMKEKVLPPWINADDPQYRFYAMDATYNLWFNTYFAMPLVRGYVPAITSKLDNWLYWSDTSITKDDIVNLHNVPAAFAKNYALFNIDWLAIKYLEGAKPEDYVFTEGKKLAGEKEEDYYTKEPRASRQYFAQISSYLINNEVIKKKEWWEDCQYFEVQDNVTSPLIKTTRAPAVLVIGDDEGYDVILKNIAIHNYNSQYLIPVHVEKIDDLSPRELKNYEAVILYNYQYKNSTKAFKLIDEYVKGGGRLYLETGSRSPQESAAVLPDFFPIYSTNKMAFSRDWQFNRATDQLVSGVEFEKFSEASYLQSGWGVSYSPQTHVKDWAKTILTIQAYPVMVSGQYGQGEVIWSGFNLPYHILAYNNEVESVLFKNILNTLVDLEKKPESDFIVTRLKSEKILVSGEKATGLVFKESAYPGWQAQIKSGHESQSLKIRPAGLDFMYIRIPEGFQENFEMKVAYRGTFLNWLFYVLSGFTIFFILDYIILRRRIFDFVTFNFFTRKEKRGLAKKVGSWWDKDEV